MPWQTVKQGGITPCEEKFRRTACLTSKLLAFLLKPKYSCCVGSTILSFWQCLFRQLTQPQISWDWHRYILTRSGIWAALGSWRPLHQENGAALGQISVQVPEQYHNPSLIFLPLRVYGGVTSREIYPREELKQYAKTEECWDTLAENYRNRMIWGD